MVLFFNGDHLNDEVLSVDEHMSLFTLGKKFEMWLTISWVPNIEIYIASTGNLGEGTDMCRQEFAKDESEIVINCPSQEVIGRIFVFYGDLEGECECPPENLPDPQCPSEFPHFDSERQVRLPNNGIFLDGACCAAETSRNGRPKWGDMDIRVRDPDCSSKKALEFGSRRCIGRSSCTIRTNPNEKQTMSPIEEEGQRRCKQDEGEKETTGDSGDFLCEVALNSTGEIDTDCLPVLNIVAAATCFPIQVDIKFLGLSVDRQQVATTLGLVAAIVVVVYLIAIYLLIQMEKAETDLFNVTSAEDFTIFIDTLPDHDDVEQLEVDLQQHLERILTHSPPVAEHNDMILIADINFCMDYTEIMGLLKERGRYLHKLEMEEYYLQLLGMSYTQAKEGIKNGTIKLNVGWCETLSPEDQNLVKCIKRIQKLIRNISSLDRQITIRKSYVKADKAVAAFVTFVTEEGKLRALREFPQSPFAHFCSGEEKMLNGITIKATMAPSPSDVIWENIPVSPRSRFFRIVLAMMVTLAILFLAAVAVFFTEDTSRSLSREFASVDCHTLTDPFNKELAIEDELPRHDPAKKDSNEPRQGRIQCFCQELWRDTSLSQMREEEFLLEYEDGTTELKTLCDDWFQVYLNEQLASYGSILIIITVNFLLRAIMKALVSFEKLPNRGDEILSRAMKVFSLAVLNTGVLLILVNSYLDSRLSIFRMGSYRDFTTAWYEDVGFALALTMILNIFVDHGSVVTKMVRRSLRRCYDRRGTLNSRITRMITQTQLNKLYEGPTMMLDERYARQLATVFLCLMFCTGVPLLLPIAAVYHAVLYFMDKFFFVRVYRTPPVLSNLLSRRVLTILPFASALFLPLSIWMLSNERIFPPKSAVDDAASFVGSVGSIFSGDSNSGFGKVLDGVAEIGTNEYAIGRRATMTATLPLFLILVLLIICFLVYHFLSNVLMRFLRFCTCGLCAKEKSLEQRGRPTYWESLPVEVLTDYREGSFRPKARLKQYYDKAWSSLQKFKEQYDELSSQRQEVQRQYQHNKAFLDTLNNELIAKRSQTVNIPFEIEKVKRQLEEHMEELHELQQPAEKNEEGAEETERERKTRSKEIENLIRENNRKLKELSQQQDRMNQEYEALQSAVASQREVVQDYHNETARLYKEEISAKTKLTAVGQAGKHSAKRMTGLHSYAMRDNVEYGSLFGYTARIKDPRLRLETSNASQSVYELQEKLTKESPKRS